MKWAGSPEAQKLELLVLPHKLSESTVLKPRGMSACRLGHRHIVRYYCNRWNYGTSEWSSQSSQTKDGHGYLKRHSSIIIKAHVCDLLKPEGSLGPTEVIGPHLLAEKRG